MDNWIQIRDKTGSVPKNSQASTKIIFKYFMKWIRIAKKSKKFMETSTQINQNEKNMILKYITLLFNADK